MLIDFLEQRRKYNFLRTQLEEEFNSESINAAFNLSKEKRLRTKESKPKEAKIRGA